MSWIFRKEFHLQNLRRIFNLWVQFHYQSSAKKKRFVFLSEINTFCAIVERSLRTFKSFLRQALFVKLSGAVIMKIYSLKFLASDFSAADYCTRTVYVCWLPIKEFGGLQMLGHFKFDCFVSPYLILFFKLSFPLCDLTSAQNPLAHPSFLIQPYAFPSPHRDTLSIKKFKFYCEICLSRTNIDNELLL